VASGRATERRRGITPSERERFWENESFAAVGHTTAKGFPKLTYAGLRKQGRKVFAVDPSVDAINGDKTYPDLASLPERVEAVVLEVPREETESWVRQAADASIRNVWIHMTRETPEALALAKERGLNVLTGTVPASRSTARATCARERSPTADHPEAAAVRVTGAGHEQDLPRD
jgi:predicted CoA-binding protein